mmetsp:Transcript_20693/g.57760  ORF Transcript_20693/g.57760 Transcript_20693/m.57760 type:complete len:283 (-) Transcript_20693:453-1301(-)
MLRRPMCLLLLLQLVLRLFLCFFLRLRLRLLFRLLLRPRDRHDRGLGDRCGLRSGGIVSTYMALLVGGLMVTCSPKAQRKVAQRGAVLQEAFVCGLDEVERGDEPFVERRFGRQRCVQLSLLLQQRLALLVRLLGLPLEGLFQLRAASLLLLREIAQRREQRLQQVCWISLLVLLARPRSCIGLEHGYLQATTNQVQVVLVELLLLLGGVLLGQICEHLEFGRLMEQLACGAEGAVGELLRQRDVGEHPLQVAPQLVVLLRDLVGLGADPCVCLLQVFNLLG